MNKYEVERMQKEDEEREKREKEWIETRFGKGPFTQVEKVLIEEICLLKRELQQIRFGGMFDFY